MLPIFRGFDGLTVAEDYWQYSTIDVRLGLLSIWDISFHRVRSPLSGFCFLAQQLIILGYFEYEKV